MAEPLDAVSLPVEDCSIARSLGSLGEKWALLVFREIFSGVRRFDDMQSRLGAPRQVLSARLTMLVEQGFLRREPYQEPGSRTRYEYRLTDKGRDLYPILVALLQWGDRYVAGPGGPAVALHHRDCGAAVRLELRCTDGHVLDGPREVTPRQRAAARSR